MTEPPSPFLTSKLFTRSCRYSLCKPRDEHQREQRAEHRSGAEREQLFLAVPPGKVYQWLEAQQRLAAGHSNVKRDDVRRQRSVCVAVFFEMNDHDQLWKQDDVDQIGAHGPEAVDGRDSDGHSRGGERDHHDGQPHDPDDFHFGRLKRNR